MNDILVISERLGNFLLSNVKTAKKRQRREEEEICVKESAKEMDKVHVNRDQQHTSPPHKRELQLPVCRTSFFRETSA